MLQLINLLFANKLHCIVIDCLSLQMIISWETLEIMYLYWCIQLFSVVLFKHVYYNSFMWLLSFTELFKDCTSCKGFLGHKKIFHYFFFLLHYMTKQNVTLMFHVLSTRSLRSIKVYNSLNGICWKETLFVFQFR